jgi:TamB, inner membrane protein subunit of TAM complex
MQHPEQKPNTAPSRGQQVLSVAKVVWRRIENIVFALILFLVFLYFLLQMPAVQNWLVQKVTTFLSEEWQTKVSIQRVDIEFFDNLILEGLYVEDVKGDTLFYAGRVGAGMKRNFFAFLGDEVEFTDISLYKARVNIRREEGDKSNTLKAFLSKLSSPSGKKSSSKSIVLKVQNLHLDDVVVLRDIETYNKKNPQIIDRELHEIKVPYGLIRIHSIDPDNNLVDIRSVHLDGLSIDLEESERRARSTPPPPATPVAQTVKKAPSPPMIFRVGEMLISNGRFELDQFDINDPRVRTGLEQVMDYEHLQVQNITLQGEKLEFNDEFDNNAFVLSGAIKHLSARERCGFTLTHAEVGRLSVSDTLASLINTKIQTASTSLGDTVQFRYTGYRDLRSFEDSVDMNVRLAPGSVLRLGDLNYFEDDLAENDFFIANANELASVSGYLHGRVNRLRADNVVIGLDGSTYIACNFRGNGLSQKDEPQTLNFEFKELRTDLKTIGRIVPGFKPPEQFLKLGSITFKGDYQLFDGIDHVLYGDIKSELGAGRADMHLNLKDGKEKAVYSGGLEMFGFDLATWTGDKQFGRSTFHVNIAENSTGLTLPTIKTNISGKIDTLSYRGYNYRDISLNGAFKEKVFDGVLKSEDPNIDFNFDGTINLREDIPKFEFTAKIRRLDLEVLNLTSEELVLFGDIERLSLQGKTLNDITGTAMLRNLKLLQNREDWHRIDSLRFISSIRGDGSRYFGFNADIAKCELTGTFNLNNIIKHLGLQLQQYHPAFARRLGVNITPPATAPSDDYQLLLQIRDSKNFTKLISEDLDTLRNVNFYAHVDAKKGHADMRLETPEVMFDGIKFKGPSFRWNSQADSAWFGLRLTSIDLSPKQRLPPIDFSGQVVGDELFFNLQASEKNNQYLENLYLKGTLSTVDSLWQVRFNSSKISMFSQEWRIADDNFVRFGTGIIKTREFEFFNGNQRILLEDVNEGRGLKFSLTNFNLDELNRFLDPNTLTIRGNIFDFDVSVQDVFKMEGIEAGFLTDTVFVNKRPYGALLSNIEMESLGSPLYYKVFLQHDNKLRMRIAGAWLPDGVPSFYSDKLESSVSSGEIFATAALQDFPFDVIETFIPEISKTAGRFAANLVVSGSPDRVGLTGNVNITEGQFQIDYLKSMFYLKNQEIKIARNKIEVKQDTIWDASQQHMAIVQGTLEHDYFQKWRVNCNIESVDRSFMILNTSAEDNDLFYGQGIGYFNLSITGSFARTNMVIDATTGKDTRLYIPLYSSSDAKEVSFIRFTNRDPEDNSEKKIKKFSLTDLKGLNFEMNLSVTEDAEVQLIFDEQAGDIIKSRGEGDIKLSINREGEFKMYGGYRVTRGEYLFTLLNFVNKPFNILTGGTINWFGDPYGAELNLDAVYEQNTAVYNFIRDEVELLTSAKEEATKATKVVATMHLSGDLMKPDITFGLEFPNITSQLKSLTDNKLRLLRQDQNEMSRQIFGLVVIGSFLPSNSGNIQPTDYVASAFNTFTQMISNQFSNYLAGLASEWFNDDVSSIDLDIIYSDYQNVLTDPQQTLTAGGRELQVRLKSGFIDDRITVQVGSQFGLGGSSNLPISNGFLGEDVTIEIKITENNQWRLKVYQRTEPDISGQRRDRYGIGLSFQKDYDSFGDMWKGFGGWLNRRLR